MRLKNIFALALIVFGAASCSMENELMENNAQGSSIAAGEKVAYVSFNVDAQKAITKAGETPADTSYLNGTELADVTSCSIILMDEAGYVFKAFDNLTVTGGVVYFGSATMTQIKLDKDFGTKKFDVLVVANTAQQFNNPAIVAYSDIQDLILGESDMNQNIMVSTLSKISITGYATLAEAQSNPVAIEAALSHLTAKVVLSGFNVSFREGTLPTDVTITNVSLLNVNTSSKLFVAKPTYMTKAYTPDFKVWDGATNAAAPFIGPAFNTFANQAADNAIAMELTLTYGNVTGKTFQFIINRPGTDVLGSEFGNSTGHNYIKEGYIYKIYVNAHFAGDLLDCTIKCYTLDWKYNTWTANLLDITPR